MSDRLQIPCDLAAWHRWSATQHRLRTLRSRVRPSPEGRPVTTYRNSAEPATLIVSVASTSTSARAALFAPLNRLDDTSIAVITDVDLADLLPTWEAGTDAWRPLLASARAVLGDGHYLKLGHEIWSASRERDIPYFVSQHGALTPLAPPLPPGAHLLAWSDADAAFWASGRADVKATTVGSQLLWEASVARRGQGSSSGPSDAITYAGQLHGAEMPRWGMTRAALAFCRANGAHYRPHPGERDRLSRAAHVAFARAGVQLDTAEGPLSALPGGLVSVFSTSVLEAAACGRPAWVDYPHPPPWLAAFWARYGMRRWGEEPTPPPCLPTEEPASRIREVVLGAT